MDPRHPGGQLMPARPLGAALRIVPVTIQDAKHFVEAWHRHNRAPVGALFAVGVADDADVLRGVAIIARPTARAFQDGMTAEVSRTATDGVPNGNSMLYGAAWRAARALGYRRLVTYTHTRYYGPTCADEQCLHYSCQAIRVSETGTSLRAAGWQVIAERPPRAGWSAPSRPRNNSSYLSTTRTLWEA
jgi:hypothetical protein